MRLTTTPEFTSYNIPALFRQLIGGLRNIKNKYFANGKDTWNEQYKNNYSLKMDCADQQPRNLAISGIVLENLKPGLKILDIGCGTGTLFNYLSNLEIDYLGIDLSELAIKEAEEKFSEHSQARFVATDFEEFTGTEKFDMIIFNEVLYYFPLNKILSVVKKSFSLLNSHQGIVIVSMACHVKSINIWRILKELKNPFINMEIKTHFSGSRWTIKGFGNIQK